MPYLLLLASAFAGQALLFVPVVPVILAAGALTAHGQMHVPGALLALTIGIAAGDFVWYALGRFRGTAVLNRICRLAGEPDTCVRRAENLFGRYGARALLVAKFIPGLSTVVLPLAGVFSMRARRFVMYDVPGVLAWSAAYLVVGYLGSQQITRYTGHIARPTVRQMLFAGAVGIAYFAWKLARRHMVRRQLRMARISVDELHRKLEAGEPVTVVDLRHPIDFERDPYTIPRARYIPAEDIEEHVKEIPRDREVVLYCTCPDEVTSAREALRLRAAGLTRVRPLQGGFSAWRDRGYPVERVGAVVEPDRRILNAA